MDKEQIETYLQKHDYITLGISKADLTKDGGARYFELLSLVGEEPVYGKKFCGKMFLAFKDFSEEELWHSKLARNFVQKLADQFPYLFFLAEKEQATLKLLTILACANGEAQREDLALDKDKFNAFLQAQMKGIVQMSQKVGFSPEMAQSLMDEVYAYFGL